MAMLVYQRVPPKVHLYRNMFTGKMMRNICFPFKFMSGKKDKLEMGVSVRAYCLCEWRKASVEGTFQWRGGREGFLYLPSNLW